MSATNRCVVSQSTYIHLCDVVLLVSSVHSLMCYHMFVLVFGTWYHDATCTVAVAVAVSTVQVAVSSNSLSCQ
jgi:hypothetical protein